SKTWFARSSERAHAFPGCRPDERTARGFPVFRLLPRLANAQHDQHCTISSVPPGKSPSVIVEDCSCSFWSKRKAQRKSDGEDSCREVVRGSWCCSWDGVRRPRHTDAQTNHSLLFISIQKMSKINNYRFTEQCWIVSPTSKQQRETQVPRQP